MMGPFMSGSCIGGTPLLLVILGLIVIGVISMSKTGGLSRKEKQTREDETKMIQDMYYELSKMEERIEVLETILIERQKKDFDK